MTCNFTEKISALIDGELSTIETREVERHLMICLECQETRAEFFSLRTQLGAVPVVFDPVVQREALSRIIGKPKVDKASTNWRWVFNPAVVAVASLLIVAVVIGLLLYPRVKPGPKADDLVAGNRRKPVATPAASPNERAGERTRPGPKPVPPAKDNGKKAPVRKRPPVIVEPPEDNIAKAVPAADLDGAPVRAADTETMTAIHFQKSELLLRSFRNVRSKNANTSAELSYEKRLAQQLVYQNMMLRKEADASGDAQVASLLESLEPILLDIANLPAKPAANQVRVIKDRVERKNIVALLQVNSTALARALD
ncbi:MAG TPA: zf-HC2 domain-containing protein [Pyrinomonadaceae bacterium]